MPLGAEGWLTPTGALRKEGWHLKMTMNESAGGRPALAALQTYVRRLDKRYGKQAFRYFSAADMRGWAE